MEGQVEPDEIRVHRGLGTSAFKHRRARPGIAERIARVIASQDIGQQGGILEGAGEDADLVQRERGAQHAAARDHAAGGLEAPHPAEGGRADHRAVGLGADGQGHVLGRHRRCRAAGRAPRRMGRVMRVARPGRIHEGQFGGYRLAHDHRARLAQPLDKGRIVLGVAPLEDGGAALGGIVPGVDDVLQSHRNAVERPHRAAAAPDLVQLGGLGQGVLGVEMRPGPDLSVRLLDPVQAGLNQIDRAQNAPFHQRKGLGGGDGIGHRLLPYPVTSGNTHRTGSPAATGRSPGTDRASPC